MWIPVCFPWHYTYSNNEVYFKRKEFAPCGSKCFLFKVVLFKREAKTMSTELSLLKVHQLSLTKNETPHFNSKCLNIVMEVLTIWTSSSIAVPRNCWMSSKHCRPWPDAAERGVWSGSTMFAQAYLSQYLGLIQWTRCALIYFHFINQNMGDGFIQILDFFFWVPVEIQSTLVISNSLISNNRLSRSENLVPVLIQRSTNRQQNIVEKRRNCSLGAISPLFRNIFNISLT